MISSSDRKFLLNLARQTILSTLRGEKLPEVSPPSSLTQNQGAFVTLHEEGDLRGCIGRIVSHAPLWKTVRDMAIEAATKDPRFIPVELAEMDSIHIEISVLSPLETIQNTDEIELGTHGVLLKKSGKSAVFLPQVASEFGWNKEEFLSHLCRKAGLPLDAWKEGAELSCFCAEILEE